MGEGLGLSFLDESCVEPCAFVHVVVGQLP